MSFQALNVRDFGTLHMLLEQELGSSKLTNDRTMLMERIIQASDTCFLLSQLLTSVKARFQPSARIKEPI